MKKVSELFEANAYTPCQVANLENGNAGFRVPEYQRSYNWSKSHIDRLMMDIFSSFERLSRTNNATHASAFTFLGTLILVKDYKQEPRFKGKSFSIVDGQQRLTTLALVSCALIEQLRKLRTDLPKLPTEVEKWLDIEAEHLELQLADCVYGSQKVGGGKYHPFPKIVRTKDFRSDSPLDEEMRSGVAVLLKDFRKFIESNETEFHPPDLKVVCKTQEADKITKNFLNIKKYCHNLNNPTWYTEKECRMLDAKSFVRGGCGQLWERTQDVLGNDASSAIRKIEKVPEAHPYFRTLMLAAYFCNCIAVTTVVTADETAAFDIFDALNTTGEPLTALETLKPLVIAAENKKNGYTGSECETAFGEIDKIMTEDYSETQKQNETKNLIVTFALYLEGRKISRELSVQRSELRQFFQKSRETDSGPAQFMRALEGVARYRSDYWVSANCGRINGHHLNLEQADEVKLLSFFISAMKTSLALPILSRYWIIGKEESDFTTYIKVLKAVSAFTALRRAATGRTDGIDTCFRDIMDKGYTSKKFGLCAGPMHQNVLLELSELKEALRSKLNSSKVRFNSKDEWINHVVDIPIYTDARPLARFLLFSATHNTAVDPVVPGLLTREGIARSDDRVYLSPEKWTSKQYLTVEHVAPVVPNLNKPNSWDAEIYANPRLINTLGNLILLPAAENASIGSTAWSKKKIFYSALANHNLNDRKSDLEKAKQEGMQFKGKAEGIILGLDTKRLSMLDGIHDVDDWNAKFIEQRSRRLAALAWDQLRPWLD